MRRWAVRTEYVTGPVEDGRLRPPRPAETNEMGRFLLGEHEPHSDPIKPRALGLHLPGPQHPGSIRLRWLADDVEPVVEPAARIGEEFGYGRCRLRVAAVREETRLALPAMLAAGLNDPLLEADVVTMSRALLPVPDGADPATLDPAEIARSLVNRWNDYRRWLPGTRRPVGIDALVPTEVRAELINCLTVSRLVNPRLTALQLKYDTTPGRAPRPIERLGWHGRIRLRCHPCTALTAVWFTALCGLLEWDGLGNQTQSGLGQVTVHPVLRASSLD